jgi:hypothetical protein
MLGRDVYVKQVVIIKNKLFYIFNFNIMLNINYFKSKVQYKVKFKYQT